MKRKEEAEKEKIDKDEQEKRFQKHTSETEGSNLTSHVTHSSFRETQIESNSGRKGARGT